MTACEAQLHPRVGKLFGLSQRMFLLLKISGICTQIPYRIKPSLKRTVMLLFSGQETINKDFFFYLFLVITEQIVRN